VPPVVPVLLSKIPFVAPFTLILSNVRPLAWICVSVTFSAVAVVVTIVLFVAPDGSVLEASHPTRGHGRGVVDGGVVYETATSKGTMTFHESQDGKNWVWKWQGTTTDGGAVRNELTKPK